MENNAKNIAKPPLPIGESDFESMIESGYYYVDKTLLIKDLLDKKAKFTLCTRPRRFGKTLNQSMLQCFFEDTAQIGGKDTRPLWSGLKIERAGEEYMDHQGKYPVIFLSLKGAKTPNYEESYIELKRIIANEFERHKYVKETISSERKLASFERIADAKGSYNDYYSSILLLSECLEAYHGKKAVILIDEYDVPLENAWSYGYYDDMVGFIRLFFENALKDNKHLQFAVVTGCLRISKESIFTGLNNLEVISILADRYNEYFGFTQEEMDAMLKHYGLENKTQIIKDWYNGYLFGRVTVYNPWSAIKCVSAWMDNPDRFPEPHWANTSGNSIVRQLLDQAAEDVDADLVTLMEGGIISKKIHEDVTYHEIEKHAGNLWNFLFFTGYLKKVGERQDDVETILELSIPNKEILYIYKRHISEWYRDKLKIKDFARLYKALTGGDAETVKEELNIFLLDTISYFDGKENFYHGVMLGVLGGLQRQYELKSNPEVGVGRCDIVLKHKQRVNGILIELKWTNDKNIDLKKECDDALKQIETKKYDHELKSEHYSEIIRYGIAFCGKYCEVKIGQNE